MTRDLFITFGGGRNGFKIASQRLGVEVSKSSWNPAVHVFDPIRASKLFGSKWSKHESHFRRFPKGYGLWLWKSIILRSALRGELGPFNRILYLDAGSQFNLNNPFANTRFQEYLELADNYGGLAFTHKSGQFGIQDFSEEFWGAPDLHHALKIDQQYLKKPQIQAGCLLLTSDALEVVEDWYKWSTRDSYYFLVGNHGEPNEKRRFIHRHDQSVLSPLWHLSKLKTLPDETWFGPNWGDDARKYPIWTIRNDSSITLPAHNLTARFKHRAEIFYSLTLDRLRS